MSGLHWYLKYWCGAHISWDKTGGAQLASVPSPGSLPRVKGEGVKIERPVPWNYYQNVVTSSCESFLGLDFCFHSPIFYLFKSYSYLQHQALSPSSPGLITVSTLLSLCLESINVWYGFQCMIMPCFVLISTNLLLLLPIYRTIVSAFQSHKSIPTNFRQRFLLC